MADMNCPYCGTECEVCHDDGHGYEEDVFHEHECHECEKTFVFETHISMSYYSKKADCLNGAEHRWKATYTYPVRYTKQVCQECGFDRPSTQDEIAQAIQSRATPSNPPERGEGEKS